MKYIKAHKIFENEMGKYSVDKLYKLLKDLISTSNEVKKRYNKEQISFGNQLANVENYSISPKRLIKLMDRELDQLGWEKSDIVDLVTYYEDDIINDDDSKISRNHNGSWFNEINGFVDTYLFSIIPNFPLGGTTDEEKDIDEGYIQYSYGWHRNDYGKMYILQNYDSIEEYREQTMTHFLELMSGLGRGDHMPVIPYVYDGDFDVILMDSMRRTKDTLSFHKEQMVESGIDKEDMEDYFHKLIDYQPVSNSSTLEMINSEETFKIHFWL